MSRPRLSNDQAAQIMRDAAETKGWAIENLTCDRHSSIYSGIGFVEGTLTAVLFKVDGWSGKVLQLERSDDFGDEVEGLE